MVRKQEPLTTYAFFNDLSARMLIDDLIWEILFRPREHVIIPILSSPAVAFDLWTLDRALLSKSQETSGPKGERRRRRRLARRPRFK